MSRMLSPINQHMSAASPNNNNKEEKIQIIKASTAKLIEEQALNHERDRQMWEQERTQIENRLEEALIIN
jgi:hypothetical protein